MKQNIGIFGGTFNPVQKAHEAIVKQALHQFQFDILHVIPCNISPHKQNMSKLSGHHRLAMLQCVFDTNSSVCVDSRELHKTDISYTVDSVLELRKEYGVNAQLSLIIGSDQAEVFFTWRNWTEIGEQCAVIIAERPMSSTRNTIIETFAKKNISPLWLKLPLLSISASMIRHNIANNIDCSGYLSPCVQQYIAAHKLYSTN